MNDHYHLFIETPEPNLVPGMTWLQNTYTRRFNSRHSLWGQLFNGRYKAILVQTEGEEDYFATLWDYIHLNPIRAGLIAPDNPLGLLSYPWSSLTRVFTVSPSRRPKWCRTDLGFRCFGLKDSVAGRRSLVERLAERARLEEVADCGWTTKEGQSLNSTLNRGWYWGSPAFRPQLLERATKTLHQIRRRSRWSSRLAKYQAEARAADIVELGLRIFRLTDAELRVNRVNQGYRVALAWALTRGTTLDQRWIAERLNLRSAANVSQQTRRFELALES
jgi:putative transposase